MASFRRGSVLDARPSTHDVVNTPALRSLVNEICDEEGIRPPGWVAVLGSRRRPSNAMAVRVGRMGSGFLIITPALFEDLDDDERRFLLRHELAHYRHAESRWALVQAMAFLSPVGVVGFGEFINDIIGSVPTMGLYFFSLIAHTLAFRSKRFFEYRADREAIRSTDDAKVAKRTLLKVSTLKKRQDRSLTDEEAEREMQAFEEAARMPANFSLRLFNRIWGTHPLVQERLATYEEPR